MAHIGQKFILKAGRTDQLLIAFSEFLLGLLSFGEFLLQLFKQIGLLNGDRQLISQGLEKVDFLLLPGTRRCTLMKAEQTPQLLTAE